MIRLRTMPGVLPPIKFFMTAAFARLALRFNRPPLRFFLLAAALALAAHAALEHDAPLLCVGNDAPDLRALALVRPAPKPEDTP